MKLTYVSYDERCAMMRKRYEFLSALVKPYKTLNQFAKDKDEWLAILGIELTKNNKYISLYIPLGSTEYETYHVVRGPDKNLVISHVIWWQDPYYIDDLLDIFTLDPMEEKDILTSI